MKTNGRNRTTGYNKQFCKSWSEGQNSIFVLLFNSITKLNFSVSISQPSQSRWAVSGQVRTTHKTTTPMAKYIFTQSEFDEISSLLKRRPTESRDEQKKTRAKIRKLGFMISDYLNGFTDLDFKKLIDKGDIEIVGKQITNATQTAKTVISKPTINTIAPKVQTATSNNKDEHYVLDLCDKVLGLTSSRQHKFDFLLGDQNAKGVATKLPVNSFYQDLNLVVEYRERQHTESVKFFDKPNKITVSGVHRGEQRKIYDERRRKVLPKYNIHLVEISFSDFDYDKQKRIIRNQDKDIEIVKLKLKKFIS